MARENQKRTPRPSAPRLTDEQRLDWIQLIRSENVGPITFRDLINHYGSAASALAALPVLSQNGGRKRAIRIASRDTAERELEAAARLRCQAVVAGEAGYPSWLEHIDAAPPVLYVIGQMSLATRPTVAVVGSRQASAAGRKFARTTSAELGRAGFVIASGLARGIDGEAHRAALETGTIAVVAGGLDVIYPPEHQSLHCQIAEAGLIVSENPPGQPPRAQDFPRRNRIISGISSGVLVVEAARRSGTLITARVAGEQGRQVFAVPGHPLDPRAVGTNLLLKQGATMATSAADIIEGLTPMDPRIQPAPTIQNPSQTLPGLCDGQIRPTDPPITGTQDPRTAVVVNERERILETLGPTPIEVDELCRSADASAQVVRAVLLELDIAGRLERHHNQLVSLLPATG